MAGFFTSKPSSNKITILILNASFLFLLVLHFKTSISSSSSSTTNDDNPSFLTEKSSNIIIDVGNCAGLHDYSDHKSKCIYVKSNLGCRPKGYVNYLQIFYCTCGAYPVLGYALILLWLALLFYLLGDTAANYFCSSLESLSTILHLSPTIAGITLLSLGNGAADVFAGIVSFTGDGGGDGDFGLNSILGGAFFVSNVVVGIISILISPHDDEDDHHHHHPITIDKTGFIRDVIFFIFSLSSLLVIIVVGRISLLGSICFTSIYVLYVFGVCTTTFFEEKIFNKTILQYCHPYHKLIRIQESETIQTSVPLLGYVDDNEDNNKKADLLEKGEGGSGSGSSHGPHNHEDRKEPSSSSSLPSSSTSRLIHQFDSSKCYYYMGKCLYVLELPLCLPRRMSIPVIKEEKWSKPFAVISVALAPLLIVALCSSQRGGKSNGHSKTSFVAYMIAGFIGLVLGNIAFLTTKMSSPPKNCLLPWLVGGFLMSVTWTYITAEELVSLLVSIGNILGISPSVLGLTVLAWGNSLADLITNVTMAKDGGNDGAQIAISGCYAGPMFNTLVGLGLSLVLSSWSAYPSCYVIPIDTSLYETIGFLIAGLLWALVILPRNNMKLDRFLGWGLLAIYMCFLFLRLARSLGLLT